MSFHTTRYFDDKEIRVGATWSDSAMPKLLFSSSVRCDSVNPDQFTVTLLLVGRPLFELGPYGAIGEAQNAARTALLDRLAEVLSK
jgi:hypothetical protein